MYIFQVKARKETISEKYRLKETNKIERKAICVKPCMYLAKKEKALAKKS